MAEGSLDALTGRIEERELTQEMRSSYLDYAMSVIVGRALPDVRDGLKPVHRRVLYAMHDLALQPNRPYRKSAFIVGEVMGKYHPHGDTAIYDTLARMAQDFSLRYPLVDGQGNFGSIDDDPPAAMRYCVAGDTRVATANGTLRIDEIVPGAAPESDNEVDVEVLDRLGRPVHASKLFHSGDHPTLRLRDDRGPRARPAPITTRSSAWSIWPGCPCCSGSCWRRSMPGDRVLDLPLAASRRDRSFAARRATCLAARCVHFGGLGRREARRLQQHRRELVRQRRRGVRRDRRWAPLRPRSG